MGPSASAFYTQEGARLSIHHSYGLGHFILHIYFPRLSVFALKFFRRTSDDRVEWVTRM